MRLGSVSALGLEVLWSPREESSAANYEASDPRTAQGCRSRRPITDPGLFRQLLRLFLEQATRPPQEAHESADDGEFALVDSEFRAGAAVPLQRCEVVAGSFVVLALRLLKRLPAAEASQTSCRLLLDIRDLMGAPRPLSEGLVRHVKDCVMALCEWLLGAARQGAPSQPAAPAGLEADPSASCVATPLPAGPPELLALPTPVALGLEVLAGLLFLDFAQEPEVHLLATAAFVALTEEPAPASPNLTPDPGIAWPAQLADCSPALSDRWCCRFAGSAGGWGQCICVRFGGFRCDSVAGEMQHGGGPAAPAGGLGWVRPLLPPIRLPAQR